VPSALESNPPRSFFTIRALITVDSRTLSPVNVPVLGLSSISDIGDVINAE